MKKIQEMSFGDYLKENAIVPPSGQTIAPGGKPNANSASGQKASDIKAIWPGAGAPVERGMTVGLQGKQGTPVPGEVVQVDQAASGVKVKNPTTGKEEWQNINQLQPFMAGSKPGVKEDDMSEVIDDDLEEKQMIERILALAGLQENCSAGATGAGAIAIAPAAMGKVKKRSQATEGSLKSEYTRKEPAKSIIGDTKPNQASGKLSADLAASGKKTASRSNNGLKK